MYLYGRSDVTGKPTTYHWYRFLRNHFAENVTKSGKDIPVALSHAYLPDTYNRLHRSHGQHLVQRVCDRGEKRIHIYTEMTNTAG